jgi:hypothetical protein
VDGVDYKRASNLYVGQVKASFGDCPEIQSKLNKARFTHKSLMQLTSEYHDYVCEDGECIIYEKHLPLIQVTGGLYMGLARSSLDFPKYSGSDTDFAFDASYKWYHYYNFSTSNDLFLGIRLRFTMPRANERLAMLVLTEYSQSNHTGYTEDWSDPNLVTQMKANAHLSSLNMMTGLQYTYPRGKLKPSLAIGPVLSTDLHSYFDFEHTLIAENVNLVQNFHAEPIRGLTMGGFSQLGAEWAIRGPHVMGCNLRYHLTKQWSGYNVNRNGISITLYYNYALNKDQI